MSQKTVWITGASQGIGAALAMQFAQQGWQVIASARTAASLDAFTQSHQNLVPLPVDVCDDSVEPAWFAQWCQAHNIQQLDALVVNAGTAEYIDVDAVDIAKFQTVFDVNVIGAARSVQWALPMMQSGSRLVFMSSLATFLPFTRAQAYAASKAAIDSMAASFQTDLLPKGIGVSVLKPGFIKTPLTDKNDFSMPFLMTPEQVAPRVYRAIVRGRRLYHFPRRMCVVLCVLRCLPKSLQHRLLAPKGV